MANVAAGKARRQRTCISCGRQEDKVRLLRIVRAADGAVSFDATGRAPGRGAYVCSAECLAAARGKKLSRALKAPVSEEEYARIAGEIGSLPDGICG